MEKITANLTTRSSVVSVEAFQKLSKKKALASKASVSSLALVVAACGSDDGSDASSTSTLLSLTKSGDNYSASTVTGFSLLDQTTAKFDVADASTNAYSIKLDATGAGTLHFDFADASDEVTLEAGSAVSGFTTLKVSDGSIDATNADLSSITRIEVASGIKITLAQIKTIPTLVSSSDSGKIEVEVTTEAEASELVSLIEAGTVNVYADANPIDLVAAPTATIEAATLTAKVTETASSVKAEADAPADTSASTDTATDTTTDSTTTDSTTDTTTTTTPATGGGGGSLADAPARFRLSSDTSGNYTVGNDTGAVTVTSDGTTYTLTPALASGLTATVSDVTSFVVNGVALETTAMAITGESVTGNAAVTITGDVTDDGDVSNIAATGTFSFGSDNTISVSSGKTLTVGADQAATATSGITGAGNVTVVDDGAAAGSSMVISATGTVTVDAGTGNDTIDLGAAENITADDSVDGGGGTDELQLTADNGTTGAVLDDLVDIDTVTVEVGSTATFNAKVTLQYTSANTDAMTIDATALTSTDADFTLVASDAEVGGILTVNGGAGDDTITTGGGADIITGGTGKDIMTGGGGNDTYIFTGTAQVASSEQIVEAASGGTDRVKITGDTDFSSNLVASSMDEVDELEIDGAKTATFSGAQLTGETIALLGGTGTQAVAVTATAAGTTNLALISGGTGWTDGTDTVTITGDDASAEVIVGTQVKDTIDAGNGDDTVTGGAGADAISLGTGSDTVIINAVVGTSAESGTVTGGGSNDDTGQDVVSEATFGSAGDVIRIVATNVDSFVHATDTDLGLGANTDTAGTANAYTILTGLVELNQANNNVFNDAGDIAITFASSTGTVSEGNFEALLQYNLTADADGSTMTGGGLVDTITGGDGADNITGGAGADILSGGGGSDVYKFTDSGGADVITFVAADDDLDFTTLTTNGTLAEVAVTNGASAYTVTLHGSNSGVYVIDTDATDLDGAGTDDAITDFTDMSLVAAFLNAGGAGAVTTASASGKKDIFIINDGDADAAYVYLLADDNDSTTTVEAAELSLIGSLTLGSSEVVSTSEVTIS